MVEKKLTKNQKILEHPATTKTDSPKIRELKHQARRHSIKEGIYGSAKTSFGDRFISPFAIAINTSSSMVAMLTSITGLLGPMSQIFGSRLIEKYSRKKIVLKSLTLRSIMWISMILLAILFYKGILTGILPLTLLLLFAIYTILIGLSNPSWFSWEGDIVDEKYRGRWFSKRNLIVGFIAAITAITASFFLDYFKNNNWTMFGFIILFSLAFLTRLKCLKIVKKQYEPKIKLKKGYYFSFSDFILNINKSNFGKFTIFRGVIGFTTSISAPLLAVYLLRHLQFSYSIYMVIIFAGTILSLSVLELWGKIADRYGNYKVLCLTSALIPFIPILWILSDSPIYLILVPSLISGMATAGFNLSAGNIIYDNVNSQKRGLAVSYYNMVSGIGIFLGASLGAILIKFLTITIIEPIVAIFILGGIARMIGVIWWLPKIKEVKKTKGSYKEKSLKNMIFQEVKPTFVEEVHEIMSIKEYLTEKPVKKK